MKKHLYAAILAVLVTLPVKAADFTLTVSTLGPESISIVYSTDPVTGINCGSTNAICAADFLAGTTVTLTAISASTTAFAGWGEEAGCGTNARTCAVLMDDDRIIHAQFNPVLFVSLFGNGGGTVTDASGTINCGMTGGCGNGFAINQSYYPGTQVDLTAVADGTSTFTGWTGAGCATDNPCTFEMTESQVVIATFTSAGPFTIAVSTGGTGRGDVTSSPAGINCGSTMTVCSAGFAADVSVTLTATPKAGYTFVGWANGGCSGTSTCVILSTSAWQSTGTLVPSAWFY